MHATLAHLPVISAVCFMFETENLILAVLAGSFEANQQNPMATRFNYRLCPGLLRSYRTWRVFFWWHWLGAVAASILLIWNVYLHSQLNARSASEPVVEVVLDTLVEQRTVYITDTIYRDRVEYIRIPREAVEKIVYVAIDSSSYLY